MQMRKLALVLLLAGMTSSVAQAEDATAKADTAIDTLQKVKNNGVIVVGHRESSVPFSYYDNQQKVVGYSQDYSNLIVDAIRKELNAPNLEVKLIPITSQNRIHYCKTVPLISSAALRPIIWNVSSKRHSQIPFLSSAPVYSPKKTLKSKTSKIWQVKPLWLLPVQHLKYCSTS